MSKNKVIFPTYFASYHFFIDGFQCLHFKRRLVTCLTGKKIGAVYGDIATKGRENGELEGI